MHSQPTESHSVLICQRISAPVAWICGLCLASQGFLLAYMAELPFLGWCALGFISSFWGIYLSVYLQNSRGSLFWTNMAAMMALGNLGMLIGWMADYGFGSIYSEGVCLCGCLNSALGKGIACGPFNWMYGGMFLACLPCVGIVKPIWLKKMGLNRASHIWLWHTIFCFLGMGIGMHLGSLGLSYVPISHTLLHFFLSFLVMALGMLIGMGIACQLWSFGYKKIKSL